MSPRALTFSAFGLLVVGLVIMAFGIRQHLATVDVAGTRTVAPQSGRAIHPTTSGARRESQAGLKGLGIVAPDVSDARARDSIASVVPDVLVFEDSVQVTNAYFCPGNRTIAVDVHPGSQVRVTSRDPEGKRTNLFDAVVKTDLLRIEVPRDAYSLNVDVVTDSDRSEYQLAVLTRHVDLDSVPLGHTIVKLVDIFDGGIKLTETDISLDGLGPDLTFMRTYATAMGDSMQPAGRGWDSIIGARIEEDRCRRLIVHSGAASTQRFERVDSAGGETWRPMHGYHSNLHVGAKGYVFTSLDGTQFQYAELDGRDWRLSEIRDRNGNALHFRYQIIAGRMVPVSIEDAAGRTLDLSYAEQLVRESAQASTRPALRMPMLSRVDGPDGWRLELAHDEFGNLIRTRTSDKSGKGETVKLHTYANIGEFDKALVGFRIVGTRDDVSGAETKYRHERALSLVRSTGEQVAFNSTRVIEITDPDGGASRFTYLGARGLDGAQTRFRNARGFEATHTLSALGLSEKFESFTGTFRTTWEAERRRGVRDVDPNGRIRTVKFDNHANMIEERFELPGAAPVTRRWEYAPADRFGSVPIRERLSREINGRGIVINYEHDERGNVTATWRGTKRREYVYGRRGELVSERDESGNTWGYEYDANGYVAAETLPDGSTKKFKHDARGRLLQEIDMAGTTRDYTYDARDRMLTRTKLLIDDPDSIVTQAFDDAGRRKILSHPDGRISIASYDAMGRLERWVDQDGRVYTKQYDLNGNLIREVNFARGVVSYEYDEADRLVKQIDADGTQHSYTYDSTGNTLMYVKNSGGISEARAQVYLHALYRPTSVRTMHSEEGIEIWKHEYDGNGNRIRAVNQNGDVWSFRFNEFDQEIGEPVSAAATTAI